MRPEGEALVVGMTLVPGFLSRNRCFALFEDPEVRRARRRAATLRGIVRHIAGAQGAVDSLRMARGVATTEVSYWLPDMKMRRSASLSDLEFACVQYLAARAGVAGIRATDEDRAVIDRALRRLASGLRLATIEEGTNA